MLRGYTCAEADPILRHRGIIHGRNPKPASSEFVPKPIHALSISDNDKHHIRYRCAGIEPEAFKLRVKVIGILPKLRTQFWLTCAELQRFENGCDHHRRQRTRVNIRMRVETQILQRLLRTGYEPSERAESFGEGPINKRDAIFHPEVLRRPAAMLAASQHRVCFINKNARAVRPCDVQ